MLAVQIHLFVLAFLFWVRHGFGQVDIPILFQKRVFVLVVLQMWTHMYVTLTLISSGLSCCSEI
jgi:ABC-type proline/glycine betaine transport system permease subunit